MARLPRLSLPRIVHYVLQRGHNGGAIVRDALDSDRLLQTLREAALGHGVILHAYAVTEQELRVLATPDSASGISRTMQALGRRYAAWFNRQHGRSGALWDGRFRSALIEAGPTCLQALRHIDALGRQVALHVDDQPEALAVTAAAARGKALVRSSAEHRTGGRRDAALVDPPEYWQLGNTPFDRESTYAKLLSDPLTPAQQAALNAAVQGAWALGSSRFLEGLAELTARPLLPRVRGRPRKPG